MIYVILDENNTVITPDVDKNVFDNAIEAPNDIIYGDKYTDGEWERITPRLKPMQGELREQAYQLMTHTKDGDVLILWEGNAITVDTANDLWMKYAAENHPDSDVLQELIRKAKNYIRDLYPDGGN